MPDVDGTPHHDPESDCSLYAHPEKKRMKSKPKFSPKPKERRLNTNAYKGLKAQPIPSGQDAETTSVFAGMEPIVVGQRQIRDGSEQREYNREIPLTISTKCPGKWGFIDMETGDIWVSGIRVGKEMRKFFRADDRALWEMLHVLVDACRNDTEADERRIRSKR